jgi:hypothetical protein
MLVLSIPVKPNNMRQQQQQPPEQEQELLLCEIFVGTSACKGGTVIYIIGTSLVHPLLFHSGMLVPSILPTKQ